MPLTIYGNQEHSSWKHSFEIVKSEIRRIAGQNHIDIVIPSCGYYGLPLCNYVYSDLNISVLYYGNAVYHLFGLYQDSIDFSKDELNIEYWIKIDKTIIGKNIKNIAKIDSGRYVVK
jgi:hypothetical protein